MNNYTAGACLDFRDWIASTLENYDEASTNWETLREYFPDPRSIKSPLAQGLSDLAGLPTTMEQFQGMCDANGWEIFQGPMDEMNRILRITKKSTVAKFPSRSSASPGAILSNDRL